MRIRRIGMVIAWCLLGTSGITWAQQATGNINGVVRDTSGAVLPGVTVEAASPALIEQVRSVATDAQGRYQIVDLRPGVYSVTFTLGGFGTLKREGLELTTGFTATVNAELRVGSLEETITVTAETPLIDIQNIRQQTQLSRQTLESIPGTGRLPGLYTVLPAAVLAQPTVYSVGSVNERVAANYSLHGAPLASPVVDGMNATVASLLQGVVVYNQLTFQEVVVETSGIGADRDSGGAQVNIVQRDGGNMFSGAAMFSYSGPSLESSNFSDTLAKRGLQPTGSLREFYDVGAVLGGPIKRNQVWFLAAVRSGMTQQYQQGVYYNKLQGGSPGLPLGVTFYEPDLSRPSFTKEYAKDVTLRLTWQPAPKHRVAVASSFQPNCNCLFGLLNPGVVPAPESTAASYNNPNAMPVASWTYTVSNRILLEAGASGNIHHQMVKRIPGVTADVIQITEQANNFRYGSRGTSTAAGGSYTHDPRWLWQQRFALSYVTGSHKFKTGFNLRQFDEGNLLKNRDPNQINQARDYTFRNRVPVSVRIWAIPHGFEESVNDIALYAQDQWTIQRATLNLGLRYNDASGSTPEQVLVAGPFVAERRLAATSNVPHWQNLDPRVGAAYDLFGNGKTAVKASLGRYSTQLITAATNPARTLATSATRTWDDNTFPVGDPRRGNYVPDCVLGTSVPGANGECGALSDLNFGKPIPGTRYASDALEGFNRQDRNWQASAQIQQELRPGVGLNVAYFRTWYGGFLATDNELTSPSDYDPYCITAPTDPRLPTSGQQICGLYDIKPALFGQVSNVVTQASKYGKPTQVYNGVDATLSSRFGRGGQFSGGLSMGRTVTDNCYQNNDPSVTAQAAVVTYPRTEAFCHISPPWSAVTQFRGMLVYPLPWELQTSLIYQDMPGIPITSTYVATNAEIARSLGRNLGQCRGSATCNGNVTIDLIPPQTMFEDRLRQLDLRFTRNLRMGRSRVRANFDVFNVFNAGNVLRITDRYGAAWLNAVQIMGGRLMKVGAQIDF